MEQKKRKVVHVQFLDEDRHEYFGSIAAIFKKYSPIDIGYTEGTIANMRLNEDKKMEGKKVVIRIGRLQ